MTMKILILLLLTSVQFMQNTESQNSANEELVFNTCQHDEECVSFHLCRNKKIITDGIYLIDRINLELNKNKCGYNNTCCTIEDESSESNEETIFKACKKGEECVPFHLCKNGKIETDGSYLSDRTNLDKCSYKNTCCTLADKSNNTVNNQTHSTFNRCGYRNKDGVGFKTKNKNDESEYGEFPWIVIILKKETAMEQSLPTYQCGGSLITTSVVLTAAHCVFNEPDDQLIVRAGEWDTRNKEEILMEQDRKLLKRIVHENFNDGNSFNDIALLIVSTPFQLKENVQTICLPSHGMTFNHANCIVAGWGKNVFGVGGVYQVILKKFDLPIVPNSECQKILRTTRRLGIHFKLNESFICAGGELDKDICTGYGGSPLVCPIPNTDNRYTQIGIVAWRIGCNNAIPGVYASVSYQRLWINDVLTKENISFSHFTQ